MTLGQSVRYLRDSAHPAESPNTDLVASALACGIPLASGGGAYHRAQNADGSEHTVVWGMEGKAQAHFKPAFPEEIIAFDEFARRYNSLEWCQANPHHPIAYLRAYRVQRRSLMTKLREILPLIRQKRGKRTLYLPPDATPEEKARWEAELRKS